MIFCQRVQRRGAGRIIGGVGVGVQRLGCLGVVEATVVAAHAALTDRLQDLAVHDVLVDVVRRRATVGPVHRGIEVALVHRLEPGVLVSLLDGRLIPIVDRLSLMISRSVM